MTKPIIGITLDWENTPTYSKHCSWYALRDNYISAVVAAGGTPILIPYDQSSLDSYAQLIDGLIIPGGDYDLDPATYNQDTSDNVRRLKQNRVNFEIALLTKSMEKKIPILGICAGMQLMVVKFGGTMIQDIPTECPSNINHEQTTSHSIPAHKITISKDSLFYKIAKTEETEVNSTHHQAIKTIGSDFQICATSSDGIIEAIEHKTYPFLLGVEWHPEYFITEIDKAIFTAFVDFAAK